MLLNHTINMSYMAWIHRIPLQGNTVCSYLVEISVLVHCDSPISISYVNITINYNNVDNSFFLPQFEYTYPYLNQSHMVARFNCLTDLIIYHPSTDLAS